MSLMDDDRSMSASISSGSRNSKTRSRSLSKTKKLVKRGKSPVGSGSDRDSSPSGARTSSRLSQPALASGRSRSPSVERGEGHSDYEEEGLWLRDSRHMDESERDLVARLELARRNSQNQSEMAYPAAMEKPIEETIYEGACIRLFQWMTSEKMLLGTEEPPIGVRPTSRASRMSRGLPEIPQDAQSQRSTTPQPRSTTPGDLSESDSPRESRSTSRHVSDRRPIGPRSPSPLPPSTPIISTMPSVLSEELDISFERTLINMSHQPTTPHHDRLVSPIPRSKRQPFEPTGNTDLTPRAFGFDHDEIANPPGVVEPLSIKKKSSVRENGSPTQGRRTYALNRNSPLMKARDNPNSSKRVSSLTKTSRIPVPTHLVNDARVVQEMNLDKLISLSESTKEDVGRHFCPSFV